MRNSFYPGLVFCVALALTSCDSPQVAEEAGPADIAKPNAVIDPAGIRLPSVDDKTGQLVEFGTARKPALAAITAHLEQTGINGKNEECGAGPMEFVTIGDLTLNFQGDKFVGWLLDGYEPDLKTPEGVGVGAIKETIVARMPIVIQADSTLGIEFQSDRGGQGSIGGFLSASDSNGAIESMYGGTNCFFR
ncbi:hypothetical protein [Parasphingorhabdus sp.]|uniref:hypothetical protein n=1 Tax=Parasphingorhabdus sp. TaxID=2709688 RepID=UPI00326489E7